MLRTKPVAIRVRENPFGVPGLVQIVNGAIPDALRPFADIYTGPLPHDVKQLDAQQFAHDVREQHQRETAAPAAGPVTLTVTQVCARFEWSLETLGKAQKLGFPRVVGQMMSPRGNSPVFLEKHVAQWHAEFSALAAVTKSR